MEFERTIHQCVLKICPGLLDHYTVFKFVAQYGRIDYVASNMSETTRDKVTAVIEARWSVEIYHREVKQTCGIERCQVRTSRTQNNHIFLAISAWFEQCKRRVSQKMSFYLISKNGRELKP